MNSSGEDVYLQAFEWDLSLHKNVCVFNEKGRMEREGNPITFFLLATKYWDICGYLKSLNIGFHWPKSPPQISLLIASEKPPPRVLTCWCQFRQCMQIPMVCCIYSYWYQLMLIPCLSVILIFLFHYPFSWLKAEDFQTHISKASFPLAPNLYI